MVQFVAPARASSTHHHADVVLLPSLRHLHALVNDQVHEGIETPQNALHVAAAVQLHCKKSVGCKGQAAALPTRELLCVFFFSVCEGKLEHRIAVGPKKTP